MYIYMYVYVYVECEGGALGTTSGSMTAHGANLRSHARVNFSMGNATPIATPMDPNLLLSKEQSRTCMRVSRLRLRASGV